MCISPVHIKDVNGYYVTTSCGQCRQCRLRRKLAWIGRLRLENQCHLNSRFLTLTYAADPGILNPDELRDFLKRYRYYYGAMRFFAVGEYGDKNGRGHWHLLIFGHPPGGVKKWLNNKAWDKGFTYDGTCTPASIAYCSSYMLKHGDDVDHRVVVRQSLKPGIGFQRIEQMALASPKNLTRWPSHYLIGSTRYPLCQGGLAKFQTAYLDEGGIPINSSPINRHYNSTLAPLVEGDSYIDKKRLSLQNHLRSSDGQALPRTQSHKKLET